ncbi:MAG: hypothetical protein NVS2B5_30350 [Beijerinckiaceae bacterium]
MLTSKVEVNIHPDASRMRRDTLAFAVVAVAAALIIIGNIAAAGPAVYRPLTIMVASR